jgi:uncharacterized protein YggE
MRNPSIKILFIAGIAFASQTGLCKPDYQGITAQGQCLKKVSQDRASVTLTSSILAATASEATQKATKANQNLRSEIQNLKLQNMTLETESFNVGEEREWVNKKMVSKGFRARISLVVETSDISRIGESISAASNVGIKDVGQLQTFVSKEKYKLEYENCLETAAKNAKDKALKLAKGAGVTLGKVQSIIEGLMPSSTSPHYNVRTFAMAKMGGESDSAEQAAPEIDSKPEDLSVVVTVTFDTN